MAVESPKQGRGAKPKKAPEPPSAEANTLADPDKNWAADEGSAVYQEAARFWDTVDKAFKNKEEQTDAINEYWSIQNCVPDDNQMYSGNSQGYIPAVRDAINARAKRALKQLFPVNNKHVEALASDGQPPYTQLSLLEHYIRKLRLKDIVRTDLVAGDVEGQWNLMVDWTASKRTVTRLVTKNPIIETLDGEDVSALDLEDTTAPYEDTEDEEVIEEGPEVIRFATEDLAVIPPTASHIQKAHAVGVRLRLSPDKVRELVDEGVLILPENLSIEEFCQPNKSLDKKDPQKRQVKEAGVKTEGTYKHAVVFMVYKRLAFDPDQKSSGIIFYAMQGVPVGIIRNPLWSGKVPIISEPVEKTAGSFFGQSKVEPVKFMQWQLNDFWNQGMDSASYSLLPIYKVDPLKCPQWAQLTMGLAAMWPVAPDGIEAMQMPQLWKDAAQVVDIMKRQIWQSMDVTEMMMGVMPPGRKNAQMVGGMQQEASVSIVDHASRYEDVMLNPLAEMIFELDQQYRDKEVMVEKRGPIGAQAAIRAIPVQQWGERYFFRWSGTEYMVGLQRMQQQIAWMNVLKGIPPQQLNGRVLDVTPILEAGTENLFGPELAPKILIDKRNEFAVPPEMEDEMLANGFAVPTHEADDDPKHLQAHMQAAATNGDPMGLYKEHMMAHMAQLIRKREMQMAQAQPKGVPGGPGGGPGTAPPQGVAGAPRPGALPAPGRPAQNPPGAVNADQMADPMAGVRG